MKIKLLFLLLLICQVSFAQHRTCGMREQMQKIMNDPAKRAAYLERESRFEAELQKLNSGSNKNANATIRIPVAVHFPAVSNTSTQKACLRALAQTQVNILNADYNGTNADISNYINNDASFYPNTNTGSLQVEFVLATQNHPSGTGLINGDLAVTFGTDFLGQNDNDSTWAGYLNLVCRNAGNGILGYSNLGGSPSAADTVVITTWAFGSGSGCTGYVPGVYQNNQTPYDLGRTLTHELGHYFHLEHTFGPYGEGNGCVASNTDLIADTPQVGYSNYDCPAAGDTSGCVPDEYALTMNYMDYVNDACMYMFTAGQATRMLAHYNSIASQFKSNVLANESFLQNDFSLYPNPNKGSFTIEFKELANSFSIEVYDITGKTIYENNYDQSANLVQQINLDKPSSGVYFVNIKSDKGLVTKKLIVQ